MKQKNLRGWTAIMLPIAAALALCIGPVMADAVPDVSPVLLGPVASDPDGVVDTQLDRAVLAQVLNGTVKCFRARLTDDLTVEVQLERLDARTAGGFLGVGRLTEVKWGQLFFVSDGGVFEATVFAPPAGTFAVRSQADGSLIVRRDPGLGASLPCGFDGAREADEAIPHGANPCPTSISTLARYPSDDGSLVDVMVYYTPGAVAAAGTAAQLEAEIDMAASITNQSYVNSQINPRIQIIRKAPIDYIEQPVDFTDLVRLTGPSDGYLDSVHAERDQFGGDLVCLVVANVESFGGAAFSLTALGPDDDGRYGFSVIRQDNLAFETMAHEFGHNYGCQHDRQTNPTGGFFNYSYGYREPGNLWKTIMAYPPGTTIPYFSNPNLTYNGPLGDPGPMGVPGDDPTASCNNALTINNTAWTLANFRPSTLPTVPPARLYVRSNAPPGGSGASWATAMNDLQAAICKAVQSRGAVTEIWTAAGTYKPDRGRNDRLISFRLANGVSIYGGFNGTETLLSQRNPAINVTILSGDIGAPGNASDNTYHVVSGTDLGPTAVLDGFTITGGNANGPYPHEAGGGMQTFCGNPTVVNCRFASNQAVIGGAVRNIDLAHPTFTNCAFESNTATQVGGAMHNWNSTPQLNGCTFNLNACVNHAAIDDGGGSASTFVNCTFSNNSADWGGAAGIYNAMPTFTTCTFQSNHSVHGGGALIAGSGAPVFNQCNFNTNTSEFGGIYLQAGANAQLTGCTFTGNTANDGAGVYVYQCNPILSGCTFTSNAAGSNGQGVAGAFECVGDSAPTLQNCQFVQNSAGCCGGAVTSFHSTITLRNCTFSANTANYGAALWHGDHSHGPVTNSLFFGNIVQNGGGALHATDSSDPVYTGCVFSRNRSFGWGGAAWNVSGSTPNYINCTFSENLSAFATGGLNNDGANIVITNCILWHNSDGAMDEEAQIGSINSTPTVNYSIIQGLTGALGGVGNSPANPLFVDPDGADNTLGTPDDNVRVQSGSPAIDSGQNAAVPAGVTTDPDGHPRFVDVPCVTDTGAGTAPIVDRGAYEFLAALPGDVDGNGVVNLADVTPFAGVLLGTDTNAAHVAASDTNCDGLANGRDVRTFAQALLGS